MRVMERVHEAECELINLVYASNAYRGIATTDLPLPITDNALYFASTTVSAVIYPLIVKVLIGLVACLIGLISALIAGIVAKRTQPLSVAIAAGGGAFIATAGFCLLLAGFVLSS